MMNNDTRNRYLIDNLDQSLMRTRTVQSIILVLVDCIPIIENHSNEKDKDSLLADIDYIRGQRKLDMEGKSKKISGNGRYRRKYTHKLSRRRTKS